MQPKPSLIQPAQSKSLTRTGRNSLRSASSGSIRNTETASFRSAVACIDNAALGTKIFRHSKAVAAGLEIPLKLMHVLPGSGSQLFPSDPIEWQLKQREAEDCFTQLLANEDEAIPRRHQLLLHGEAEQEISRWSREHPRNLMAMATRCNWGGQESPYHYSADISLGRTAQKVVDESRASLLLIPPHVPDRNNVHYQRIMVPLDGSARAESVLPYAVRIARNHGAELILTYAVPSLEVVEVNLHDGEARNLVSKLDQLNKRNATTYLERLKNRLSSDALNIKIIVESHGDARDSILRTATEHMADLLVLSGRGQSGIVDIPCGNVARHIASHASIPTLLIRHQLAQSDLIVEHPEARCEPRLFWGSAH